MIARRANLAALTLLAIHAALLAWAATRHSPSIDEVGHISAGLSHWRFGRFDLYRVNPPLVRLIATAPVALSRHEGGFSGYSLLSGARSEFECGEQFILANGKRSFWLFTLARWACIPFSLLGGYVCYRWAGELYGAVGALVALALWCFCPNVLAHGQMITPDIGAAALGAAACYLFWRWLRGPTWTLTFAAGVALGLAELTKATFLALYGIWPLAWLVWRKSDRRTAAQLVLMAALSVYVLNLGYAFEGTLQPLGGYSFISAALGGPRDLWRGRRRDAATASRTRRWAAFACRCRPITCWASTARSSISSAGIPPTCGASGVMAAGGTTTCTASR